MIYVICNNFEGEFQFSYVKGLKVQDIISCIETLYKVNAKDTIIRLNTEKCELSQIIPDDALIVISSTSPLGCGPEGCFYSDGKRSSEVDRRDLKYGLPISVVT